MQIHSLKHNSSEISHIPERWWLITSIKIKNEEILFLNEETLYNPEKNVRWWIPIMFPNAWPLRENNLYKLSQHWFARNKIWYFEKISNTKFMMFLESDEIIKEIFPFDFRIEIISEITVGNDCIVPKWNISQESIKITQKIINTWDKTLPISPWLHPYFFVKNQEKKDVKILLWDEYLKDYSFCEWKTVYLENPCVIKIIFITWKTIVLNYSKEYKKLWIRSEAWKDFICIEPVYEDEQSILDKPFLLEKWKEKSFEININLQK